MPFGLGRPNRVQTVYEDHFTLGTALFSIHPTPNRHAEVPTPSLAPKSSPRAETIRYRELPSSAGRSCSPWVQLQEFYIAISQGLVDAGSIERIRSCITCFRLAADEADSSERCRRDGHDTKRLEEWGRWG